MRSKWRLTANSSQNGLSLSVLLVIYMNTAVISILIKLFAFTTKTHLLPAKCDCVLTNRRFVDFSCLVGQSSTLIYVAVPNSPALQVRSTQLLLALVILAATANFWHGFNFAVLCEYKTWCTKSRNWYQRLSEKIFFFFLFFLEDYLLPDSFN